MSESRQHPDTIKFGCFDPNAETNITERNLPHWFQAGAAIFVTFRTADSMPHEVIQRWQSELEEWLTAKKMPLQLAGSIVGKTLHNHDQLLERLSLNDRREFKKLSDRVFHRSLDECHGACLFRQPELAKIVGEAIKFYENHKYDLDCFVVMPNHVHAIVQFRAGQTLKIVSQSWMRYSARLINALIGRVGDLWQPEPFDHIIRSPEQFEYLQTYVSRNPKKGNLQSGHFLFWDRSM